MAAYKIVAEKSLIQELTETFGTFPGIGPRQARRFVQHLLRQPAEFNKGLAARIAELKRSVGHCRECRRFFSQGLGAKSATCAICADATRDAALLLVVEKDVDVETIERSNAYSGLYFVLGELLPLTGETNTPCRWPELLAKVEERAATGLREVVLALAASTEGDSLAEFLKQKIAPLKEQFEFTLSTFGRGLSTGTEVEYADADTIRSAFRRRES